MKVQVRVQDILCYPARGHLDRDRDLGLVTVVKVRPDLILAPRFTTANECGMLFVQSVKQKILTSYTKMVDPLAIQDVVAVVASQHMNRVAPLWTPEKGLAMTWKLMMMSWSHRQEIREVAGVSRSQEDISRMIGDQRDFIKMELPRIPIGEVMART